MSLNKGQKHELNSMDEAFNNILLTFSVWFPFLPEGWSALSQENRIQCFLAISQILKDFSSSEIKEELSPDSLQFSNLSLHNFISQPFNLLSDIIPSPISIFSLPENCIISILFYLNFESLISIRSTCKYFREMVTSSPFWQQKIPITQLEYYQFNCQRFGWNIPRSIQIIFMGWFDKGKEIISLSPTIPEIKISGKYFANHHIQYLPKTITHLDLSGCYNLTDEGLNLIPCGNLTHLILPWSRGITDRGVNCILYRSLPNLTIRFEKTISAIYWATFFAYETTFRLLMEKTKGIYDINELNGVHGLTCLYLAAGKGLNKMVTLLLHYGADPNKPIFDNKVPLMPSSYNGHFDIVISLLSNRADVTKRDNHGYKAANWAVKMGHLRIASLLLRQEEGRPLFGDFEQSM